MAIIHVDDKQYEADPADNLLQACLSRGLDIPYFCWHPALGSVGACRQCAVKLYRDENDKVGRIVMSCMTPAADNTRISIVDPEAKEFREGIIALLMTNHPHDCPVCEEGGHCHLQDMTVMTGHYRRQYHFTKRTHLNQELGPFIAHEMNRCIACYRCVRYYNDYAGGTDLGVFGSAAHVYFGREQSGTLQSEFSGNLTEVCPTGVFTDKTHSQHYARKWDMQFAPSICAGCAVACNISPGERYGEVRRIENRYHGEINGYFLCDRGRFGYGYVNRRDRPRKPLIKHDGDFATATVADALAHVAQLLASGEPILGIGSPRASLEANYMLRALVGAEAFCSGMTRSDAELTGTVLRILHEGPVAAATLRAIDIADAVLVLGEDVLATAPRVALALRQAARGKSFEMTREKKVPDWQAESAADIAQRELNPIYIATPAATGIDDIARQTLRIAPDAIATLGFAVANALDPAAAAPSGVDADVTAIAGKIAAALLGAKRPLIVSGTGLGSTVVIQAAANVAWALHKLNPAVLLSLAVPEANSLGVALFAAPALEESLQRIAGAESVVVVLENDLERRLPRAELEPLLARARLVVLDHQMTGTTERAEVILPAATFAEATGTLVNMEGRAQRYFQNFDPAYYDRSIGTLESWRWLDRVRGGAVEAENLDDVLADFEADLPQFKGVAHAAPGARFRMHGMGLARAPHRQSGRTAARAIVFVHEPRATKDPDTPLTFSMEGYNGAGAEDRPPELLPFAWAPGWNSPQAWNKFQTEVGGALKGGDPGVFLFEAKRQAMPRYFAQTVAQRGDGLRLVPLYEHFGSEELSSLAEPIRVRGPASYVVLNRADAQRLGIDNNDITRVTIDGIALDLPASARDDFPRGAVGLPVGLPGIPPFAAGGPCSVGKGG
jgi:NADH-quinone oxidoreductase subunit G